MPHTKRTPEKVHITDLILRDAHQCLIATRLRTEDMLPICEKLDQIGFWSLEAWGGATFDACVRFLKEDPWERLRQLKKHLPKTPLQMLLRGQNLLGYRHYADDLVRAFVERAATNGIDVFRIFDALNDVRNLETAIAAVKSVGKHAQGTLCYTTSPVHGIPQFVEIAKQLEALGCDSIAIKDMAGLLTPLVTSELVTHIVKTIKIPLHLHTHATAGLAEMCQWKAIEAGCRHIDTAISAFASGASHPPTESMVAALRETPYDTGLDLQALQEIGVYFYQIRKKYHQFESDFTGIDTRVQVNQVPGGMISNLYSQLKQQGALERMHEVLREIPHVRKDLGYPPLVTPTSQIVGTQALLNVITGERYKTITNEVKLYLQGRYGKTPGKISASVRQKAIGKEEVIDCRPADLLPIEFDRLKAEIGDLAETQEDILTYAMFPEVGKEYLLQRRAGKLVPEALEPITSGDGTAQTTPVEFNVTMHGESYHIKLTGTGYKASGAKPYYVSVDGVPEEILVEALSEQGTAGKPVSTSHRPTATKPGHVTASMPCVVVEVKVKVGDNVKAGDTVLITEAMKMETEVHAAVGGKVSAVHVAKGDSVTPQEALIEIKKTRG